MELVWLSACSVISLIIGTFIGRYLGTKLIRVYKKELSNSVGQRIGVARLKNIAHNKVAIDVIIEIRELNHTTNGVIKFEYLDVKILENAALNSQPNVKEAIKVFIGDHIDEKEVDWYVNTPTRRDKIEQLLSQ